MTKKGPLLIVPWRCTFACDSNCAHCTSAKKQAFPDEINTQTAKQLVDQVSEFGASFFGVTGGQPFLRKDLFEVLDYATSLGLNTSIITDGRMLDEKAIKNIIKNKTKISVSIDGAEQTNDAIRGKGAYAAAIKAIESFAKADLLNVLVYTFANAGDVTNANEADMVHVIELAKKYGARWVVFHGFIPYSSDASSLKADLTPAQYEWACNKLYDLTQKYDGNPGINVYIPFYARVVKQRGMIDFEGWYNSFFLGRCFFGKFMSIAENGDVIPCSYNDVYHIGNIKNRPIKQIWQDLQDSAFFNKVQDKNNLKGKCGVCEYNDICGGCRSAALFYTGDIFGSDPRCGYVPQSLRK
ncbi:MAG: radical SAM protein [Candidatus Bathyarchaeota archaeon]|nr:radical SAM protein [Candidatus Bathyarchaeota archaeon]